MLEAKAESPSATDIGFNAIIKQRNDNLANGKSKIKFSVQKISTQSLGDQKFTVFLFFGDNFYKEYSTFTSVYGDFKDIEHEYIKAGTYKPLLVVYSNDLKTKVFKFLDPITVEQKNVYKPIAFGKDLLRTYDAIANTLTIKFSAQGSYDTQSNSNAGLTYHWDFGDGDKLDSKTIEVNHTYVSAGTFLPTLIVETADGRLSDKYSLTSIVIGEDTIIDYNKRSFATDIIPAITAKINQAPLLNAKIQIEFSSNNSNLKLSTKKYTVFVFFGDDFYKSYNLFTEKFSSFSAVTHVYAKPGVYKPLVIAYSADLKDRLFKFLDPVEVTKIDKSSTLPIAQARLIERLDDRLANSVTANLSSEGSFDPYDNSTNNLKYSWDFGDGVKTELALQNVIHIYNQPGTFIPSLIVKTTDGRVSKKYDLDPIVISKQIVCLQSRDSWVNSGVCRADCGGLTGEQLQVNLCGEERTVACTSSQCRSNTFKILNDYVEAKQFISLDANTDGFRDESKLSYRYIISSASEPSREQIYKKSKFYLNNAEPYKIILEIYEDSFKASSYTQTVQVVPANQAPIIQATADQYLGETPLAVKFNAIASRDPEGSNLIYEWDFGDKQRGNGAQLTHTFVNPGTYVVDLKVTDTKGLSSNYRFNNIVVEEKNYAPQAKFIQNIFDCKLDANGSVLLEPKPENKFFCNVELDGLFSSDPNGNINDYSWTINFFNPVTNQNENVVLSKSTSPKFTYQFNKFGTYDIQLKVTDAKKLFSVYASKLKILEPVPLLKAEIKNRTNNLAQASSTMTFSANGSIYYQNSSNLNPGLALLDYVWDFGDGSNGKGLELQHKYTAAGVYSPVLKVNRKNDESRKVLAEKNLESIVVAAEIPVLGSLSFSNLDTIENGTSAVSAVTVGAVNKERYQWIYRAFEKDAANKTILMDRSVEFNQAYGAVFSSILDAPQSFTEAGQYQLVHQLDDKPILSETLTVLPNQIPVPNLQVLHTTGSNYVTVNAEGSYDPKSYEINSYEWDFSDGTISHGISATHTYANNGIYYIKLTVVDAKGQVANAYSKAIIVGDFADKFNPIPQYVKPPDIETGDETIAADFKAHLKFQSIDDPVSDFDSIVNIPNDTAGTIIQGLSLPVEGSCTTGSGGSCQCNSGYANNIAISSIVFNAPNASRTQDKGATTIDILGSNFCKTQHEVKVSIDGGSFEDRPSNFINNGKIVAKLKTKDFKGTNLKVKVLQKAANNSTYYTSEKAFTIPVLNPSQVSKRVLDGDAWRIEYSLPNIFIESSDGYGNAYHIFKDGLPTVYETDAMIITKNISLDTAAATANQAKLKVHLNGNRFDGIRVWVNGNLVLTKDPATGVKFYDLVSDPFSITSGSLNLQIKILGPSTSGVQVKAVTIYTAPRKPTVDNLKLDLMPGTGSANKKVKLSMDTVPKARLQAVHINRQTTQGANTGKYKILQADTANGNDSGKAELIFDEVSFLPGTHCVYFYLTNGSHSDEAMEEYIKTNLVKPYNQALAQGKFAFINSGQFNYLQTNALPIKHGICFNENHEVKLNIVSPPLPIILQQNNQPCEIQLSSEAPDDKIRNGWEYEVKIFDGTSEANSARVINIPVTKTDREKIQFPLSSEYIGNRNMVIRTRYYDTISRLTYVGEVSTQFNVVVDKKPVAKVVTEDVKKLILEPSDNPAEKATFLGYYSYDPNKASSFGSHINDGIGSYAWLTQYKDLEASPDAAFTDATSNYDPRANTYYIGPRKEPGVYRARLTVEDFYRNSDTAFSDSVQVIRPGQNLVASLSVNNATKIFEPDLNGKSEVSLNAKVKVISAKNNPPTALSYKFIYGDGIEESGTVSPADIQLNKYIALKALTERKHIYNKGEYDPKLTVSATLSDGHSETWTVSAGTVTIAKLPTHVAFTPIIANLGPKDIPNPGFKADLKVTGKTKFGTKVEKFGWDFGDGTNWTYSGNQADSDFMKATITDMKHTYSKTGTYQIKFWVKTIDSTAPIVYALKPLVIENLPAPVISELSVNKQTENIKVSDEEIINIEAKVLSKTTLQRMEVVVHRKGNNEIVYSKSFTDKVPTTFTESFEDMYLPPGNYILDILVIDDREQTGGKALEFGVERALVAKQAVDISRLEEFYTKDTYTSNVIHKVPIEVNRFLKAINIYNNGKKIKAFEGVKPDTERLTTKIVDFFKEIRDGEIYIPLHEGNNSVYIEVILPNGKVINSKPYKLILDSTSPVIEIETPADVSIFRRNKLTLSGRVFDENLTQLFYRLNSNQFKKLAFTEVEDELDLSEFEKDIDLNGDDIKESNFIEVKAVDAGGNIWYANTNFIVSDELANKIANKPKPLMSVHSSDFEGNYDLSDEEHDKGDAACEVIREAGGFSGIGSFMEKTFTNVTGIYGGVYSMGSDGYYAVHQGYPFNLDFKLQVCDYSIGESRTTTRFSINPYLNYAGQDHPLSVYKNQYPDFNTLDEGGGTYRYVFDKNLAGLSKPLPYLHYLYMNDNGTTTELSRESNGSFHSEIKKLYFDFNNYDSIKNNWNLGSYVFKSNILFNSGHKDINGTMPDADKQIGVNIVGETPDEYIEIINVDRRPETVYLGHDIDNVIVTTKIALRSPVLYAERFEFYIKGPVTEKKLGYKNDLQLSYTSLGNNIDPYNRYLYYIYFNASNLPRLTGRLDNIDDYYYHVRLLNENGDAVAAEAFKQINILPAPDKYVYLKTEEVFPESYTNEQRFKERGFVSVNPKQFKLTVYHIADNGLTLQETLKDFDPKTSQILSRLKINKISLDNLDRFAENGHYGEKSSWNGNQLVFNLIKDSVLINPDNVGLEGVTKQDLEKYKGYWKTEYLSSGPDDGKIIIKDAGKLEFDLHMEDWFEMQKSKGFGYSVHPDQHDVILYDLDPYPIPLENLELIADDLFFEPNLERMLAEPEQLYLDAGKRIFRAILSYKDKITDSYRLPKFEYKNRDPKTNEEKEKLKAGFLLNNSKEKNAFVDLDPFALASDIKLDSAGNDKYKLELPVSLVLNNPSNTLLKKDQMVNLELQKTTQIPISIITKSNQDLDIELRGTYENKALPIRILDLPKFELMQGKKASKLSEEELKVQSAKVSLDSKDNLHFSSYYSNIVGKGDRDHILGFDPLELEVQLYDASDFPLGETFYLNQATMKGDRLSSVISRSYKASEPAVSIRKKMNVNLSKYVSDETRELIEEAEFVRVKLNRDKNYLQGLIPSYKNIYDYYDVNDNDPYRSKYLKIISARKNACYFSYPGSTGRYKELKAFNEKNINENLKVHFTSESKSKSKVWVTYLDKQAVSEANASFVSGSFTSENFSDENNPSLVINVDQNRVDIGDGIFNFKNYQPLKDVKSYTLIFKVAKSNVNDDDVVWDGFDADKAAACIIEIVKGIENAQVFIDRLEPTITNLIPVNRDYIVYVRTQPVESIAGVNLFLKDLISGNRKIIGRHYAIPDGAYITVNLKDLGIKVLNHPFQLIAELTYNSNTTEGQTTEIKATRDFMFVEDTEPIITFGGEKGTNDLGDSGSGKNGNEPNVIYAPAGRDYVFNGMVTFTNINDEDTGKISFKFIDKAVNQVATKGGSPITIAVNSITPTNNSNEYVYEISTTIPFQKITDIKEYVLEAYFDNKRLSDSAGFLIVDDPIIKTNYGDGRVTFNDDNEAELLLETNLVNGFMGIASGSIVSYINNDPKQGELDRIDIEESRNIPKIKLTLKHSDDVSGLKARKIRADNDDLVFESLSIVGTVGKFLKISRLARIGEGSEQLTDIDNVSNFSNSFQDIIKKIGLIVFSEEISYSDSQILFDYELTGMSKNHIVPVEDVGSYIQIYSSTNIGNVFPCLKILELDCLGFDELSYDLSSFTPAGKHTFTKFDGTKIEMSNSYVRSFKIVNSDRVPPNNFGLVTLRAIYDDKNGNRFNIPPKTYIVSTKPEDLCLITNLMQRKQMDQATAIKYFTDFIDKAISTSDQLVDYGIQTDQGVYDVSEASVDYISNVREDMLRLIPKLKGNNVQSNNERLGYCESLFNLVSSESNNLIRVFESKNHLLEDSVNNYGLYLLHSHTLQSIYREYGYKRDSVNSNRLANDYAFMPNTTNTIRNSIIKSKVDDRGKLGNDTTTFEYIHPGYPGIGRLLRDEFTHTSRVRTTNYVINSAYPVKDD